MKLLIAVCDFPKAFELNSILYDKVWENISTNHRAQDNLRGRSTGSYLHKQKIKEVDILMSWIKEMLPEVSRNFASEKPEEKYGFNVNAFEIEECWGAHYNKGESLQKHNHFPYIISFVYYVRTPKGFSPITIEDNNIDVKAGQCVYFLSHYLHEVHSNKCDGRCVITGNVAYKL